MGVVITGTLMAIFGWVVLQVRSYFLADELTGMFLKTSPTTISTNFGPLCLPTMVTMGMMMLAGAGSSVKQTFGLPAWLGSAGLAIIVYFVCFLDARKGIQHHRYCDPADDRCRHHSFHMVTRSRS